MAWTGTRQALRMIPSLFPGGRLHYTFDGIPLATGKLSRHQKMNLVLSGFDSAFRRPQALSLPPTLQVEPTNRCNLKCPLCPTGSGLMERPQGIMTMDTFDRILADLGDVLVGMVLYSWGEPFLNPRLPEMIRACTKKGMATVTSTNGHFLQSFDEAMAVVDAGLTGLVIAMDGATQETYRKYRIAGDVERVHRCATFIEEAKSRTGSVTPVTNLRVVATRENEKEIPKLKSLAQELEVDLFSYKSLGCLIDSESYGAYETTDTRGRRFITDAGGKAGRPPDCPFAFRQPTVFWDGTVVGCEFDYGLETPWGNIHDRSFKEIWNGPEAVRMRRRLRGAADRPDFCGLCPYRGMGGERVVLECSELRPTGAPGVGNNG